MLFGAACDITDSVPVEWRYYIGHIQNETGVRYGAPMTGDGYTELVGCNATAAAPK